MQTQGTPHEIFSYDNPIAKQFSYTFLNKSKAEEYELLKFIDEKKGRWGSFWMPTWVTQFDLLAPIETTGTLIVVLNRKFSSIFRGYERFFILLSNGDMIVRQITKSTVYNTEAEVLTYSTLIPQRILPSQVVLFGLFMFVRFDTDEFTFNYQTDTVSTVNVSVVELVKEYPT
jgi:hypothetical protein